MEPKPGLKVVSKLRKEIIALETEVGALCKENEQLRKELELLKQGRQAGAAQT